MTIQALKIASDKALAAYMSTVGKRNVVARIDAYKAYMTAYGAYTAAAHAERVAAAQAKYANVAPYSGPRPLLSVLSGVRIVCKNTTPDYEADALESTLSRKQGW